MVELTSVAAEYSVPAVHMIGASSSGLTSVVTLSVLHMLLSKSRDVGFTVGVSRHMALDKPVRDAHNIIEGLPILASRLLKGDSGEILWHVAEDGSDVDGPGVRR